MYLWFVPHPTVFDTLMDSCNVCIYVSLLCKKGRVKATARERHAKSDFKTRITHAKIPYRNQVSAP